MGGHFSCVSGGIFWMGGGILTFFMGEWEWVDAYFGWVVVGGHFLWVSGGGWKYILGEWGWVEVVTRFSITHLIS